MRSAELASAPAAIIVSPRRPSIDTSLPSASPIHQIDGLQILRAVAVLLVAWIHAGQFMAHDGGRDLPGLGVYGVDIFFVISGFIISSVVLRSRKAAGPSLSWDFLKRRLVRIFPIYWILSFICVARLVHSHDFSIENHIASLLLLPSFHYPALPYLLSYSWTLVFEMFFYATISFLLLFAVRRAIPLAMALFVAVILLGQFNGIRHPFIVFFCNPMLLEFVFGAAVALFYGRYGKRHHTGLVLLLLGAALAATFALLGPASANGMQMILTGNLVWTRVFTWGLSAALVVGGMVFWSPSVRSLPARLAVLLGNASYSTYLASIFALEIGYRLLRVAVGRIAFHSFAEVLAAQVFGVLAVFALGWLCYRFVERPVLRLLTSALITPSRAPRLSPEPVPLATARITPAQ